jgi:carboxypeptidase family protein
VRGPKALLLELTRANQRIMTSAVMVPVLDGPSGETSPFHSVPGSECNRLFSTVILGYDVTVKSIVRIAAVFCFLTICYANESTIEYTKVRKSTELSGVVLDGVGAPISEVRVSEMSDNWSTELRSTSTDSRGQWSFTPTETGKTYKIQLRKVGFHPVRMRVKVTKHHAKPLVVEMPVA